MSTDYLLVAGEEQECPRCRQWHVLDDPYRDVGTPYTQRLLYVTCNGKEYFAGSAGKASPYSTRPATRRA